MSAALGVLRRCSGTSRQTHGHTISLALGVTQTRLFTSSGQRYASKNLEDKEQVLRVNLQRLKAKLNSVLEQQGKPIEEDKVSEDDSDSDSSDSDIDVDPLTVGTVAQRQAVWQHMSKFLVNKNVEMTNASLGKLLASKRSAISPLLAEVEPGKVIRIIKELDNRQLFLNPDEADLYLNPKADARRYRTGDDLIAEAQRMGLDEMVADGITNLTTVLRPPRLKESSQLVVTPTRTPVLLPFDAQHALLTGLQHQLEKLIYNWTLKNHPSNSKFVLWDSPSSTELHRWPRIISQVRSSLPNFLQSSPSSIPTEDALGPLTSLRHIAVHRIPILAETALAYIKFSVRVAKYFGDEEAAARFAKLEKGFSPAIVKYQRQLQDIQTIASNQIYRLESRRDAILKFQQQTLTVMYDQFKKYGTHKSPEFTSYILLTLAGATPPGIPFEDKEFANDAIAALKNTGAEMLGQIVSKEPKKIQETTPAKSSLGSTKATSSTESPKSPSPASSKKTEIPLEPTKASSPITTLPNAKIGDYVYSKEDITLFIKAANSGLLQDIVDLHTTPEPLPTKTSSGSDAAWNPTLATNAWTRFNSRQEDSVANSRILLPNNSQLPSGLRDAVDRALKTYKPRKISALNVAKEELFIGPKLWTKLFQAKYHNKYHKALKESHGTQSPLPEYEEYQKQSALRASTANIIMENYSLELEVQRAEQMIARYQPIGSLPSLKNFERVITEYIMTKSPESLKEMTSKEKSQSSSQEYFERAEKLLVTEPLDGMVGSHSSEPTKTPGVVSRHVSYNVDAIMKDLGVLPMLVGEKMVSKRVSAKASEEPKNTTSPAKVTEPTTKAGSPVSKDKKPVNSPVESFVKPSAQVDIKPEASIAATAVAAAATIPATASSVADVTPTTTPSIPKADNSAIPTSDTTESGVDLVADAFDRASSKPILAASEDVEAVNEESIPDDIAEANSSLLNDLPVTRLAVPADVSNVITEEDYIEKADESKVVEETEAEETPEPIAEESVVESIPDDPVVPVEEPVAGLVETVTIDAPEGSVVSEGQDESPESETSEAVVEFEDTAEAIVESEETSKAADESKETSNVTEEIEETDESLAADKSESQEGEPSEEDYQPFHITPDEDSSFDKYADGREVAVDETDVPEDYSASLPNEDAKGAPVSRLEFEVEQENSSPNTDADSDHVATEEQNDKDDADLEPYGQHQYASIDKVMEMAEAILQKQPTKKQLAALAKAERRAARAARRAERAEKVRVAAEEKIGAAAAKIIEAKAKSTGKSTLSAGKPSLAGLTELQRIQQAAKGQVEKKKAVSSAWDARLRELEGVVTPREIAQKKAEEDRRKTHELLEEAAKIEAEEAIRRKIEEIERVTGPGTTEVYDRTDKGFRVRIRPSLGFIEHHLHNLEQQEAGTMFSVQETIMREMRERKQSQDGVREMFRETVEEDDHMFIHPEEARILLEETKKKREALPDVVEMPAPKPEQEQPKGFLSRLGRWFN